MSQVNPLFFLLSILTGFVLVNRSFSAEIRRSDQAGPLKKAFKYNHVTLKTLPGHYQLNLRLRFKLFPPSLDDCIVSTDLPSTAQTQHQEIINCFVFAIFAVARRASQCLFSAAFGFRTHARCKKNKTAPAVPVLFNQTAGVIRRLSSCWVFSEASGGARSLCSTSQAPLISS